MRRKLLSLLKQADLREEEIQLYLLLLTLRHASMSELIAKSKLNVMTAYRTMDRLLEQGLVSAKHINKKERMFRPLSLQALISKLSTKQRKLRKLELALSNMDSFLPYVDVEPTDDNEPIAVHDGLDAFREEYLKLPECCKEEYLHVGSMENYWSTAGMTYDCAEEINFRKRRMKRGVYARIVNRYSAIAEEFVNRDSTEMRTTKLVRNFPQSAHYIAITESQVSHFVCNREAPRTIVIKQPELMEVYRNQFTVLWE